MVKSYINFRNCLCISERSLFLRGCFYFVFILQNFGSLAPLIFFKQLFFIKINFSHMKHCVSFVFTNSIFFQNIKLSFIETIIFSNKQFIISMDYNLKFLSNVIELNFSTTTTKKKKKKRIKTFKYFREKITSNRILFSQKTHSSYETVINWHGSFKGALLFSNRTSNSCGVMIRYLGSKKIKVNRIKNDNQGRFLIVDVDIDDKTFVLINLYNANFETKQIKTIYELDQLPGDFYLESNK